MSLPGPVHGLLDGEAYEFPTWREALIEANDAVPAAYDHRRRVFQRACREGLTLRQIAEATGMSAAGVHKIVGNQRAGADALDEPVGG